jgi:signal transduction histidine kinase
VLDVRDDGVGIDATRLADHRGEGLQGMRDRMLTLDGRLHPTTVRGGARTHALRRQAP